MKFLLAAITFILMPTVALAWCENYPDITVADEMKMSKFVAIGTVTHRLIVVDPIEDPEGYEAEIFNFKIQELFRGPQKGEISIYNVNTAARFPMEVGKKYLVFVRAGEDGYWINNCGNSDEYESSAKPIADIRKLLKPKSRH